METTKYDQLRNIRIHSCPKMIRIFKLVRESLNTRFTIEKLVKTFLIYIINSEQ